VRVLNHHPKLQVDAEGEVPASIVWISEALRRAVPLPPTVFPVEQRVIYSAPPDLGRWEALERRPASAPPTIAFIGRVEEAKGPTWPTARWRSFGTAMASTRAWSSPGFPNRTKSSCSRALPKELRLEERMELRGQLDHDGVASLFARASALVVPSTWQEPFALVLLQAALARLPAVDVPQRGNAGGALHEDEHAFSFPIGDSSSCAAALARGLTDARETRRRTQRAYEHAKTFTPDR
jgi:glycosyltransferase involved in cell wall biosynthesis